MQEPTPDYAILAALDAAGAPLLGTGSEARVYGHGDQVIRIHATGTRLADAQARARLLEQIAAGATHLRFLTPHVLDVSLHDRRVVTRERRLPGRPVSQMLPALSGTDRQTLLLSYLDAIPQIAGIDLPARSYGALLGQETFDSWQALSRARLNANLSACPADLRQAVADTAECQLPEPQRPSLVHLDYFPANVLCAGTEITAVLDFGSSTLIGDARMDAWSAVAYLDPEISPAFGADDRLLALEWLEGQGLAAHYPAARRWLAAYWSFAVDDADLMRWCRRILLGGKPEQA